MNRDKIISVRLSLEEFDEIKRLAKEEGQKSINNYIIKAATKNKQFVVKTKKR